MEISDLFDLALIHLRDGSTGDGCGGRRQWRGWQEPRSRPAAVIRSGCPPVGLTPGSTGTQPDDYKVILGIIQKHQYEL